MKNEQKKRGGKWYKKRKQGISQGSGGKAGVKNKREMRGEEGRGRDEDGMGGKRLGFPMTNLCLPLGAHCRPLEKPERKARLRSF